ncbi:hypothetical protein A7J71_22600 [Achromobacter insolitus]|uniref:hypothetical protein n=1 Tax=Achromobacter insolitus TaxID=217204 RepID=UPI0007C75B73|nr:hypothetical protein [Achromobacter insolitus]AXA70139.1 hypothetical protein CE205_05680 [Achromobacter insolitus]OAE68843.1 hypothetical protein A7J71_22600 [Achromobacter insolitus]OCZ51734.1 hypothetical protein A7P22_14245 [Achromobacter insolitus]
MNKLLIVGHPSTPCEDIENLLNQCGMAAPLPSRQEGMSPQQINDSILKGNVSKNSHDSTLSVLSPIVPGPIWNGLVLDLILGNIDQSFWGWSDPNAARLLDYWKDVDPTMKFVLVYSDPRAAIKKELLESGDVDATTVEKLLANWCAVNSTILRFHNFNRDRSVLVHADEALSSVHTYVQQLRTRLDAPLNEPPAKYVPEGFDEREQSGHRVDLLEPRAELADAEEHAESVIAHVAGSSIPSVAEYGVGNDALENYLVQQLLNEYPDVCQLYEEMQACANLPANHDSEMAVDIKAALVQFRGVKSRAGRLADMLKAAQLEQAARAEALSTRIQYLTNAAETAQAEEQEKIKGLAERIEHLEVSESALRTVNEQLSLGRVQLQSTIDALTVEKATVEAEWKRTAEKLQHSSGLLQQNNVRLEHSNTLLLEQLHAVQEELERNFATIKKLKEEQTKQPVLRGAADRIKRELAYRLGAKMIQQSKSLRGQLGMLGALRQVKLDYRAEQDLNKEILLPPISSYSDAHEAARVTQHLSYRLGVAYLENSGSATGWIKLPFALKRAIKEFERDRGAKY